MMMHMTATGNAPAHTTARGGILRAPATGSFYAFPAAC